MIFVNKEMSQNQGEILFFFNSILAPNSPANNSLLTTTFTEPGTSIIKSTNFTGSIPISQSEVRHKSEIEIEVKHEKQQQQLKTLINNNNNISSVSTTSRPPLVRPTGITNKRIPSILFDDNSLPSYYQTPKRRVLTNSIQTQTASLLLNQHDQQIQQQFKSLTDETLSKNEKIQVLIHDLTDCQVRVFEVCLFFFCLHIIHTLQVLIFASYSLLFSFLCVLYRQ
jgi:hypothetical protein